MTPGSFCFAALPPDVRWPLSPTATAPSFYRATPEMGVAQIPLVHDRKVRDLPHIRRLAAHPISIFT